MPSHELGVGHATARVNHATWRRGGCLAARVARAAVGEAAERRVLGTQYTFGRGSADALYVCTDAAVIHTNRIQINISALNERLPTMHGSRTYIEGGGLMSYGPNFPEMFRRSADFVDKILRGAKPGMIGCRNSRPIWLTAKSA
jgi:ABC-type uncharacterized transport system substrate-binding protein